MKIALIDNRMDEKCKSALRDCGFSPLPMPSNKNLSFPVSSHPDMLLFVYENTLFTSRDYYDENTELFSYICSNAHYNIEILEHSPGKSYPNDSVFNCLSFGKHRFGNKKCIPEKIQAVADFVHVNQGYSSCSSVSIPNVGIITADRSISDATQKVGIPVCMIMPGHIHLSPYQYGFIGGASGVFGNTVYFTGNINNHPSYRDISDFASEHNVCIVSLSNAPLYDYGKIIFL